MQYSFEEPSVTIGLNRRRHRDHNKVMRRRHTDRAPPSHSCQLVTRPPHCRFERFQRIRARASSCSRPHAETSAKRASRRARRSPAGIRSH